MRERTRPLLAALSFLTAVPVARERVLETPDLRRAAALFPVVGGAVGAFVATIVWGAAHLVPPFAAAVLGVAGGVAATAALHLDGLGDVVDGVGASLGGRDPVEAMRDPRLGTFGVAAVALDLLLKAAVLSSLVEAGFPWPVVAAGAISRVAPIAIAWRLPYRGGGTGTWTDGIGAGAAASASIVGLAIAIPCAGFATPAMVVAVAAVAIVIGSWSARRLGGTTGDVLGACIELGETFALVAALAAA